MPHPVLEAAQRFRSQLLAQERQAATRLVQAYGRAYQGLTTEFEALQERIAALPEDQRGESSVRRLASLRSLRAQIADQVERYAVTADREIAAGVERSIDLGLRGSLATVQAYWPDERGQAMIAARWDMLATESVETMLGYTAADSPLRQTLVGRLGPVLAERVSDALVDAIATGRNPRETAALFRREMGMGLQWSLNTARTAQIWAYRDTTRLNYMNNRDVVSGWKWQAALDDRTCLSCWAQHGTTHSVDEVLNDHHSGRCVAIPIVPLAVQMGLSEPVLEPGADQFARLPEATQRKAMGPAMFEAWQAGEFKFADLTRPYADPVYGDMLRQATLKELVGEGRAKGYTTFVMGRGARPETVRGAVASTYDLSDGTRVRTDFVKQAKGLGDEQQRTRQLALGLDDKIEELIQQQQKEMDAIPGGWSDEIYERYKGMIRPLQAERDAAYEKADELEIHPRDIFARLSAVERDRAIRFDTNYYGVFAKDKEVKRRVSEAQTWLGHFVDNDGQSLKFTVEPNFTGRASASTSYITIEKDESIRTIAHEIAHNIEFGRGPVARANRIAFVNKRTAGDSIEKLAEANPGRGYDNSEVFRRDRWPDHYVGKIYPNDTDTHAASEVISMGVEYLYDHPVEFAEQDPEYFDFIVSYLRGTQ